MIKFLEEELSRKFYYFFYIVLNIEVYIYKVVIYFGMFFFYKII